MIWFLDILVVAGIDAYTWFFIKKDFVACCSTGRFNHRFLEILLVESLFLFVVWHCLQGCWFLRVQLNFGCWICHPRTVKNMEKGRFPTRGIGDLSISRLQYGRGWLAFLLWSACPLLFLYYIYTRIRHSLTLFIVSFSSNPSWRRI